MVRIRKFHLGDQKQIVQLSHAVFPRFEFDLNHWQWRHKFDKNRIVVAEAAQNIVSHWAYVRRDLQQGKKTFKTGLTMAAMTDPKWQNKGLFSEVANKLFDLAKSEGLDFLFGFPNDASLDIHKRLGFVEVKTYCIYKKRLSKNIKTYKKSVLVALNDYQDISIPPENQANETVNLVKNKRYIRWRYFDKPRSTYLIFNVKNKDKNLGFLVLKKFKRGDGLNLQLVDASLDKNFVNENFCKQLYLSLVLLGKKNGADYLSLWKQEINSVENQIAHTFGFLKDTFHLTVKDIGNDDRKFLINSKWNIKMGDTEIF